MTDTTDRSSRVPQPQWAKALTVQEAQRQLGPLESLDDVERWLKLIPLMQRTGRLRSSLVTTTMVNTVRRWCSKRGQKIDQETLGSIEQRLAVIQSKTSSGPRQAIGHPAAPPPPVRKPPIKNQRVRERRRLVNRRQGHECRSGKERRNDVRRQRESIGRRSGSDRRARDRRAQVDRRTGGDRRHVA